MAVYDEHYQKENYFGHPYPELIEYVSTFNRHKKVLDLGCGQGRDALGIARLGFSVTGVDVSKVGINQMMKVAREEHLDLTGVVGDLNTFDGLSDYDIILLDSMFHFYKNDVQTETKTLQRILEQAKVDAHVIVIVQEGKQRIRHIKQILQSSDMEYFIVHEESFVYREFNSRFHMIIAQKRGF